MNTLIVSACLLAVFVALFQSSGAATTGRLESLLSRRRRAADERLKADVELKELFHELIEKLDDMVEADRVLEAVVKGGQRNKKTGYWPSIGPLPVETRLSSFGSQIGSGGGGDRSSHKTFRYGK